MLENRRICYILSAMEIGGLQISPDTDDLVIAADAGVRNLDALGLSAGLIVGDFDSLGEIPKTEKDRLVVHPVQKDDTDTLLAVREGLSRGYHEFVIAGGLGGRLDHTLANLQTLAFLDKSTENVKNHGYLIGEGKIITLLSDESVTFHAGHLGVLSLFCVGDRAEVTIEGLKYPLDRYPMTPDFPIGVSNEFVGKESKITVRNGRVWMILDGNMEEIAEIIRNRRKPADAMKGSKHMINKEEIRCVIFDMDGTLTDSMSIWEEAGAIYLRSKGIEPRPEWREDTRPMSMTQIAGYFAAEYGITDSHEQIMADVNHVVEGYYRSIAQPKEGALELLELLKQKGIHICLATATDRYLVELILNRTGIMPYLERLYTCTDVGYGKDRPEIYQIAAASFGLKPSECLVFEDALYALKTAHNAGFPTVSCYDVTAADCEEEKRSIADLAIRSFREILP